MRALAALLVLLVAFNAGAQGPTTATVLLSRMESVALYPIHNLAMSDQSFTDWDYGIEFAIGLGTWGKRERKGSEKERYCKEHGIDSTVCREDYENRQADTTWTLIEARAPSVSGPPDRYHFEPNITRRDVPRISFELALATQTTELRRTNQPDDWTLRGQIQEFPHFSLYAAYEPERMLSPYVGIRAAVAELKSVRIVDQDSVATVEDTKVGGGAAAGLVLEVVGFNFFGEVAYSYLRFNTDRWKLPTNIPSQPASYPKNIDLRGVRWSLGVQIELTNR